MNLSERILKLGTHFKSAKFSRQELLPVIPQSMLGTKSLFSIVQASTVDLPPDDFALQLIQAARQGKAPRDASYLRDRVSKRHLPLVQRIAAAGLHGEEEWQRFYEAFRICNYQLQPDWCKKVTNEHIIGEFDRAKRPNYSSVFGESIPAPGKTYQNIVSGLRSIVKGESSSTHLGLKAISTYKRAIDTLNVLDETLAEAKLLEHGDNTSLNIGDPTYFGRLGRAIAREGFRCLFLGCLIEDLCRGERYPLSDDSKEFLLKRLIIDQELLSDPWLLQTTPVFNNIESTVSEYYSRPELADHVNLTTLLDAVVKDNMKYVRRVLTSKIKGDETSNTVPQVKSESSSKASEIVSSHLSTKERFFEFLDSIGGEKLEKGEKLKFYGYWRRSPKDIRPEISLFVAANSFSELEDYLETLVNDLKSREKRSKLELYGIEPPKAEDRCLEEKELESDWSIRYVTYGDGESSFQDWFPKVKNPKARQAILSKLERIKSGHLGDYRSLVVDPTILEARIHIPGGARIYLTKQGFCYVILWGGTKDTQDSDIRKAYELRQLLTASS